jgi:23S rRNA pseudouridine2457 synthase
MRPAEFSHPAEPTPSPNPVSGLFPGFRPKEFPPINRPVLLAFNKPYGVLSQFTPEPGSRWRTLAEFGLPPGCYPLGRLDADSEGLLLLTDESALNDRLLNPVHGHRREYFVQVEGIPSAATLGRLARGGVEFGGHRSLPCRASPLLPPPPIGPRTPAIRVRQSVPDSWIALELTEGENRQVRRMTAAVGHPTLRLVRNRIGNFSLGNLPPGQWRELGVDERAAVIG